MTLEEREPMDFISGRKLFRCNVLMDGATWDSCVYVFHHTPETAKAFLMAHDDVKAVNNITHIEVY